MEETSQNESQTPKDPASQDDFARPGFHSGLLYEIPETHGPRPLHQQAVQSRYTAHQLIAKELHTKHNVAALLGSVHRLHSFSNKLLATLCAER
jgi:hypothetical protein